jgi:hypothetical protein
MQNPSMAGHELLCLYLKSFYGLERCSPPTQVATPETRTRKAVTKSRPARRTRGRLPI